MSEKEDHIRKIRLSKRKGVKRKTANIIWVLENEIL
jgi:hypothetical protein